MDDETEFCERHVVVVGLPPAPKAKVPLLTSVSTRRIAETAKKHGIDIEGATVEVAIDPATGNGRNFGLLDASDDSSALSLERNLISVALDKKNTLFLMQVARALDIDQLSADEELKQIWKAGVRKLWDAVPPNVLSRATLFDWFKDGSQREMYIVRAGKDTLVKFFDAATCEPTLVCDGNQARAEKKKALTGSEPVWTFGEAFWSPRGSYLATTHSQGVRLWGQSDFAALTRIQHRNVVRVLFSNDERYAVTWNGVNAPDQMSIHVHCLLTGQVVRTFACPPRNPQGDQSWPFFVWSHDSKYLAAAGEKGIYVYQMPDVTEIPYMDPTKGLLNYIPLENAHFAFQSNSNHSEAPVLSLWAPSQSESTPCRLTMMSIPSMTTLTSRNLFSGDGQGRIFWQYHGDYCGLLTHVAKRLNGKRKAVQTQMEIFRMRRKNLPVDSVVAEDDILNVYWSDNCGRFSLLTVNRKMIFFHIDQKGVQEVAQIEVPREINCCRWSPVGTHFILCSLGAPDGTGILWFCKCIENESGYTVQVCYKDEMNKLNEVHWDPSGRFVTTSVTVPLDSDTGYKLAGAAGYIIWSFQGRALFKEDLEQLYCFQWRPHPPSNLSEHEKADIKYRLKDYSKKLDMIDAQRKAERKAEIMAERSKIRDHFESKAEEAENWLKNQPAYVGWTKAWQEFEAEHGYEEVVEEREEELSVVIKPTNVPTKLN